MVAALFCKVSDPNVQAFLKLLRWLENYPKDDVYNQMFGGLTFADMSRHPNVTHNRWGKRSTAAGGYMFVFGTWQEAVQAGIVSDFTPAGQDKLAWWKIGQRHARPMVCGGRATLAKAFDLLRPEWASLPGAPQSQVSMQDARNRYETYLVAFSRAARPPAVSGTP